MSTKTLAAVFCSAFAITVFTPRLQGQSLSGSSLNVTGSATVGSLSVAGSATVQSGLSISGTLDVIGNTQYFGAWTSDSSSPGMIGTYADGTTSQLKWSATRSSHEWVWARNNSSQTSFVPMMKLDSSHRLNLFSLSDSINPSIVLDPSLGEIIVNGVVLGQGSGFGLISAGAGAAAGTNSIAVGYNATASGSASAAFGIGSIAGGQSQMAIGQYNIGLGNAVPGTLSPSDALFIIGNGTQSARSNALTVTASGKLNLFSNDDQVSPGIVLDPSISGISQFRGAVSIQGAVLITQQGDVEMGVYKSGTSNITYTPVFSNGIQVAGTSTITGKTTVTGTFDVSSATLVGVNTGDSSVTTAKIASKAVTTEKMAFDGGALSGFRNRIINGAFTINQRGYASGSALTSGSYAHDRWKAGSSGCTYTFTQNKADTTITVANGSLMQIIEDANVEGGDFVLSWVGSAQARVNGGSYAASPVMVSGLPAGTAVTVEFSTGTVKDVQFESGTTSTPFERRFCGTELSMCQRYRFQTNSTMPTGSVCGSHEGVCCNQNAFSAPLRFNMRTTPNITIWNNGVQNQVRRTPDGVVMALSSVSVTYCCNSYGFSFLVVSPANMQIGTYIDFDVIADAEL